MESNAPTGVNHAQPVEVYTPKSLDGTFDIKDLNLGQSSYVESPRQVSRSNSIKKSKRSTGSQSNRTSLGLVNPSGYEAPSYGYPGMSGHVTPESATTSGAATPYNTYLPDARSNQMSPTGTYNTANGNDMGFNGVSRAPTSSNYPNGSLPHIAGQRGGSEMEWPFHTYPGTNDDYGNTQFNSGTNTPLHLIKSEADLANMQITDFA